MRQATDVGGFIEWHTPPGENPEEAVAFGRLQVFGVSHHVMAIQVKENAQGVQEAVNDPYKRLDDAYQLDPDCCYQTVAVPGWEGRWVLVAHPHGT